jgi:hypothetical protein
MPPIPSLPEWVDTAHTMVAVRPELRDNLREELEHWLAWAIAVQVSPVVSLAYIDDVSDLGNSGQPSRLDAGGAVGER